MPRPGKEVLTLGTQQGRFQHSPERLNYVQIRRFTFLGRPERSLGEKKDLSPKKMSGDSCSYKRLLERH